MSAREDPRQARRYERRRAALDPPSRRSGHHDAVDGLGRPRVARPGQEPRGSSGGVSIKDHGETDVERKTKKRRPRKKKDKVVADKTPLERVEEDDEEPPPESDDEAPPP